MIVVEPMRGPPMAERAVEIVERKGVGHPDTICDGVMEAVAVALNRAYLDTFGSILHNNIDKGLLIAGQAEKWFGGGRVVRPMQLVIGDRATASFGGQAIPVAEIAAAAARAWFGRHLPHLDPQRDVAIRVALAPGSAELSAIYSGAGTVLPANDTSAAVGYWPPTPTETAVLALERHLNAPDFKARFPETAEDVKVMAIRCGAAVDLTVAMPLRCALIASEADYFACKEVLRQAILAWTRTAVPLAAEVHLNALDRPGCGLAGVYLSLLGTSAEDADSGQVGRGNRVNGLIAVNRALGTEAIAGKNPVSHVGKIYNVLAFRAARAVGEQVAAVDEVEVLLVSRIGQPVDRPAVTVVRLLPRPGADFAALRRQAEGAIEAELAAVADLCRRLARGQEDLGMPA